MVMAVPEVVFGLFLGLPPSKELAVPEALCFFLSLLPFCNLEHPVVSGHYFVPPNRYWARLRY